MSKVREQGFLYPLKRLYWELKDKYGRFEFIQYFLRELPGDFGMIIRRRFIGPYFKSCGKSILIFPGIRFRNVHKIEVGDNVQLGVDNFYQAGGGLIIESGTIIGPGVKIWTVNHLFDDPEVPIIEQGYDRKEVHIGANVWLGANAFIMPGVTLPHGCVVSAGSVVGVKKYPPYSIISGNPARVIGNRNKAKEETKNA